jgi:uncharacterized membrane protein
MPRFLDALSRNSNVSTLIPIRFDQPIWLFLLLLIIPAYILARRSIGGLSRSKATVTFALRVIVILLLTMALAHPVWEKRGKGLTLTILLDRSQSVPLTLKKESLEFFDRVVKAKENTDDRVAVITVAKDANIAAMPDTNAAVNTGTDEGDLTATNLAGGIETALAIMPDDTANRIVLASDGNETVESVLEAAKIAQANEIPIDVVILEYEHANEVIFERIVAPARARQGQTANIKLVLRTQREATGTLSLRINGEPQDLDPESAGQSMRVTLKPGQPSAFPITVSLDTPGPKQFEAVFEPDDPAADEVERNNSAVAVTFVGGEGKVLIIDDGTSESQYLITALQQSNIAVDVQGPGALSGGLVFLAGYDAVILANIPRWSFDDTQIRDLHAYVHDLGGGLVMLGGPQSFGAGGWIDSDVAKVLPVKLDPPQTKQQVRGALALIMHSCEMPQGNYWGQKVAIAAINGLSRLDYVGIVEFNWGAPGGGGGGGFNGASWAFRMGEVGDKSAPIDAAKKMVVGDMPDFGASMQLAINDKDGLMSVRAGQRHAIIISDGDPSAPSQALLQKYIDNKVTCTTVMVGGHGTLADQNMMKNVATATGGTFYNVVNPKQLPEIFFKEAQIVSRSLIQEGDIYQPRVVTRLPGPIEGFSAVPQLSGYVLTAPREGLAQVPIVNPTSDGNDPIYAYWNYGLGKSIAFTSDITGRWGLAWASWDEFKAFWSQSIRWVMRPSSPSNMIVNTRQEGDLAVVEVEALDADASFVNFMQTDAVVLDPASKAAPLPLQQTGPGKYRGEFRTSDAGAYLVNIGYATPSAEEGGEPTRGNLQAAVCVPYSREFRDVRDNAALLQELATMTKGREIAMGSPEMADLFNHQDLEIPLSPRQIWDLLAIIAAALFLFDVAARRISIDPQTVAAYFARITGRRGEASAETVAAWKRTRSQIKHRKPDDKRAVEAPSDRDVRFEAGEDDASRAIDVGAAPGGATEQRDRPQQPQRRAVEPTKPQEDEGDYTSRLLKAKRRARGDEDGQSEAGKEKPGA